VPRVLVIHRDPAEAADIAGRLRDRGIDAQPYLSLGPKGFRGIRADPPAAILIDLRRQPSYGRVMGALIRESKSLREIPLAFIAGDPQKTALVRGTLPDAVFAEWTGIEAAIRRAIERPPQKPKLPTAPERSVAQKLGIAAGTVLVKLNPPADFELPLPDGVRLGKKFAHADVIMLWARSGAELDRALAPLARLTTKRRIWLLWPKRTSGLQTDLTMPRVRQIAIGHGLIDYKVCAVDATWSGMAVSQAARRGTAGLAMN
jgi:hypothetical protein